MTSVITLLSLGRTISYSWGAVKVFLLYSVLIVCGLALTL